MTMGSMASVLCGFISLCLFTLHIHSSPSRPRWMNLPEYLRYGVLSTGVLFLIRSVNFTMLQEGAPGQINEWGFLALLTLTYTVGALTYWVAARHLPDKVWDRLRFMEHVEREDPTKVPVMLSVDEVVDVHRMRGTRTVGPNAAPHELNDPPRHH